MIPARASFGDITGAILAGGKGRRLGGVAKGLLLDEGRPLLEGALSQLSSLFPRNLVVTSRPAPYEGFGVEIVPDLIDGRGAPGGLLAALAAAGTPWVFLTGCDMPWPSPAGVALLAAARQAGAGAVCASWNGAPQPLHALWARTALPAVERAVRGGRPSLRELATAVGLTAVPEERWAAVDPHGRAFANANTPEDVAALGLTRPAGSTP